MDNDSILTAIFEKLDQIDSKINNLTSTTTTNNYDTALDEYLKNESVVNFVDRETKECYNIYKEYREQLGLPSYTCASIRLFNKKVSAVFPELSIVHVTRNKRNVYKWVIRRYSGEY